VLLVVGLLRSGWVVAVVEPCRMPSSRQSRADQRRSRQPPSDRHCPRVVAAPALVRSPAGGRRHTARLGLRTLAAAWGWLAMIALVDIYASL